SFESLVGSLPIMLGDPRQISNADRQKLRAWSEWIEHMQAHYNYMMFRQDLPGFGEPVEGSWDGWARLNTSTKHGGIVGVFRQGGFERERQVSLPGLDPKTTYLIRLSPSGKIVRKLTGRQLHEDAWTTNTTAGYFPSRPSCPNSDNLFFSEKQLIECRVRIAACKSEKLFMVAEAANKNICVKRTRRNSESPGNLCVQTTRWRWQPTKHWRCLIALLHCLPAFW
ncbi:MAG: hypothetical protein ACWGMZ_05155, partial [Thermoguttaceae bacterium]